VTQDKATDAVIIAYRLQRMMGVHRNRAELTEISVFREDVQQLTTTVLDQ
jgi:hypothetical protein